MEALPVGPASRVADSAVLDRARSAAARCGVTRLADITRLDRIGLPVWQAVRPAGRALSVHQGKGASAMAAQIGALCEAIESHAAEGVPADGPDCGVDTVARLGDVPSLEDMAARQSAPPAADASHQWCTARNLATGAPAFLAHDLVSLDFTRNWRSLFDRSSGGLGAGVSEREAQEKALLELLENDAVGRWSRKDMLARMDALLDIGSIDFDWFQAWRAHLLALGMQLRLCILSAVTGHPVLFCMLRCSDRAAGVATFVGAACHGDREIALFGALAEAIQSRLTFVAGARDDMMPSAWRTVPSLPVMARVLPPPPGFPLRSWQSVTSRPCALADLIGDLDRAGFDLVLCKTLSPENSEIAVVKTFVAGLGSLRRAARTEPMSCA